MSSQFETLVAIYEASPVPVALVDEQILVVWANDAALRAYPALSLPAGLALMLPGQQMAELRQALAQPREPVTVGLSAMPHLGACFTPLEQGYLLQFCLMTAGGISLIPQSTDYLTSTLTSQLRGPLSGIFAGVFSLSQIPEFQEHLRLREIVRQINENSYQMLRFTVDFASYVRYLLGSEPYAPSLIDLGDLVARVTQAASVLTESAGIALTAHMGQDAPILLEADAEQLTMALLHLISNSCRFTREGNRIEVTLSAGEGTAVLTVSDEGLGIPSHLIPRIFEPFFSYDHDGSPFAGGGLGLTLVRHIVAQHRGAVAVSSPPEGGTTVAIRLPLIDSGTMVFKSAPLVADLLRDRFSLPHVILSDSCGVPGP